MDKRPGRIKELLYYADNEKQSLYLSVVFAAIGEVFGMLPYGMTILIVYELIAGAMFIQQIVLYACIAIGAMLIRALLTHLSSVRAHMAAFTILENIRIRIADKMLRVPLGVMIDTPSGTYKNLIVDTVSKLEDCLAHYLPEIVSCIVAPALTIVFLMILDWRMGLASLVSVFLGSLIASGMMRDSRGRGKIYNKAAADMNNATVEYVNGIEVIKAYNSGNRSYGKFSESVKHFHASTMDWWRHSWVVSAAASAVLPSTFIGTIPVGGYLLMTNAIEIPVFVACVILPIGFVGSFLRIVTYSQQFAFVGASLDKIHAFMQTGELKRPETRAAPKDSRYQFDAVSFGYHEDRVLRDISFQTIPGSVTALVGPSGGGKSTIAKLMAGLWDPDEGAVRLGGVNIKDIPFDQLMESVSYVAQDVFLFDKSIRENILMGNSEASEEDMVRAAKAANCHEFILSLPQGYDTPAGDAGSRLSGGERQRITIARAMLKNAPVVILDEATSFADPENEAQIQAAINKLVSGKTLVVVAHRLSTIKNAGQIIVIRDGEVENKGTHEHLLRNSDTYTSLWNEDASNAVAEGA